MALTISTDFDQAAACELYELEADQLTQRFADAPPVSMWFAYDEGDSAVGVAVATERPDGRVFITHRLASEFAYRPLLNEALGDITGPVSVTVRDDQPDRLSCMQTLGLQHELFGAGYEVRFDRVLASLPTPRPLSTYGVAKVSDVDPDRLYALDTELRGDVPGNNGWRGNRAWFDDELASDECDPTGYLIAVERETDDLIGLCRLWRNPALPSLGMLGVRRERRHGFVALRLLHDTLTAAREWGWPTFTTHTARPALQRHLRRVGAVRRGGFHRFVRP